MRAGEWQGAVDGAAPAASGGTTEEEDEGCPTDLVEGAILYLYKPDPEGYTMDRRSPFTVQHVVYALDYEYGEAAVRATMIELCKDPKGICETRDEGGSGDYYLKQGREAGVEEME